MSKSTEDALRKELEERERGYGELLGSANNDVERLSKYADALQSKLTTAEERVETLSDGHRKILAHDYCGIECDTYNCNCRQILQCYAEQALNPTPKSPGQN